MNNYLTPEKFRPVHNESFTGLYLCFKIHFGIKLSKFIITHIINLVLVNLPVVHDIYGVFY